MKGSGLHYEHVGNVLKQCDEFAVVRLFVQDKQAVMANLFKYVLNQSSVRYDFEQELDDAESPIEQDDIYCSELVWMCAKDHANLKTSTVLGRVAFSPEDVARSGTIVWSNITATN